jgi:hypothetical protein
MSLITRNNYEAYLLDYYEENLSPELIAELMLFLENNTDLKEGFEGFELLTLNPSEDKLTTKAYLKIEEGLITLINFEDFVIAEVEGENTAEESAALMLFLEANPTKKEMLKVYQQTKLIAPTLIFNDKPSLKKEQKVIPLYWWYTSAAAVILVLFLLKGLDWGSQKKDNPIVEKNEQVIPKDEYKEIEVAPNNIEERKPEEKNNMADNSPIKKHPLKNQENKQNNSPLDKETDKPQLANTIKAVLKDTIINKEVEIETVAEEIKYADNVVITYEDEPVITENESRTKLDLIKAVINQRVKEKFTQFENENVDTETYAINIGILGFGKNKKKKEN